MRVVPAFVLVVLTLGAVALTGLADHAPGGRVAVAQPAVTLTPVATGLSSPVLITNAGDGSGRLFVVERPGRIRILTGGSVLPTPFLDISADIVSGGEQGLLGLAFHPLYASNGRLFVFYTAADGANTIAEFQVSANANVVDPQSRRVLLSIPDSSPIHNGGMLAFGPDGFLYAGTGDGGGSDDPQGNGQNLNVLFGKMLRLDVNGVQPYAIPSTNPFAGRNDARPEIWAYGLRNPWRWSFDRLNGDLWIADVGQNLWEEVNRQPGGAAGGTNYGWNRTEATHCFNPATNCDTSGITFPITEYAHGPHCSVTGGYVYRGTAVPALSGAYLFGDFCSGFIWTLTQSTRNNWVRSLLMDTPLLISSFGEDEAGEVYVADLGSGTVFRFAGPATPTVTPTITATVTATATMCDRRGCSTATVTPTATGIPSVTVTPTATPCGARTCPPPAGTPTVTPTVCGRRGC